MTLKKKLAIGTAGVLAVAGTGGAIAATGHGKKHASVGTLSSRGGGDGPEHGGPGFGGPGFGDHRGPGGPDDLAAAATYLGVTDAALLTDLQSGKTLAQVAAATSGKSTAGLIAALVTHETAELNAAVTAGKVTRADADARIAGLTTRFTAMVNDTRPPEGPGDGHRP